MQEKDLKADSKTMASKTEATKSETQRQSSWLCKVVRDGKATWGPAKWHRLAARRRTRCLDIVARHVLPRNASTAKVCSLDDSGFSLLRTSASGPLALIVSRRLFRFLVPSYVGSGSWLSRKLCE